jgi:putative endonuclease
MPHFVYIIQSEKDNTFYKGYSENVNTRLEQHNRAESHYTSYKTPWKLVYFEELPTKHEALIREKQIKRYNADYLRKLIREFSLK